VDVRRVLTVGEERDLVSLAVKGYRPDGTADLDTRMLSFLAAATYIVAWSLQDINTGAPIPWIANTKVQQRVDVLRALDGPTMAEIDAALQRHREAQADPKAAPSEGSGIAATS
jgi:hypothetical protein